MNELLTASPEEVGIPSHAIERLICKLDRDHVPMHSLLIARRGQMVFEGYYAPYTQGALHRMFSVTKSLVSLAVGCLEAEGKLKLDDPICGYFPEYLKGTVHPWIASMTIRHMLEMKSCYNGTTYNKTSTTENWVESFFTSKPTHPSGTIFMYDTSSTHVLCALVERLSGKKMLDYLRGQFLDEIGFSKEAYVLPDPFGVSMGGSGLMALPADLMRLGLMILGEGKRPSVYPEKYLKSATEFHSATMVNAPIKEESYGYGWQFWRFSHNGFGCYGMGGQLLLIYPDEDLICVTTADTQDVNGGNQLIYNAIYEELFPCLSDESLPEDQDGQERLLACAKRLTVPVLSGQFTSPEAENIHGKRWKLNDNPGGFKEMGIELETDGALTLSTGSETFRYPFAFGRSADSVFEPFHQQSTASACWLTPHTLYVRIWLTDESVSSVHFQLDFSGSHVTVQVKKTEETYLEQFHGVWNGEMTA